MGGGPPEFRQGSTCLVLLRIPLAPLRFRIRGFHPLWPAFPIPFFYPLGHILRSITPECTHSGLGSSAFARRYLRNRCFFLFLRVLRCFSSPGSLLYTYVFSIRYLNITSGAFPHSDIRGSTVVCTSPQLFAAYHVLLRLLLPRHSPYALTCLTSLLVHLRRYCVAARRSVLTYFSTLRASLLARLVPANMSCAIMVLFRTFAFGSL